MLYIAREDFWPGAPYCWFRPEAWVPSDCLSEHRKVNNFEWQTSVPCICHSEDAEMVDAFPTKRKGTYWWVWGQQYQRSLPVALPEVTDEQWWPMSHFHWRAYLVKDPSNRFPVVSIGEWERLETAGEITEWLSSSSVVVTLQEGHQLTSGTYGVVWSGIYRTGVTCTVAGNEVTLSEGSGYSFQSKHVGSTLRITHFSVDESTTNHCWKPGMGCYCIFGLAEAEQPQYNYNQNLYRDIQEVTIVDGPLVTLGTSTDMIHDGTRPPGYTGGYFEGDLVYLRSLIPPQQKGTVTSVDSGYGYGGTVSFPGGHNFRVGDTVERGTGYGFTSLTGYVDFEDAYPMAYTVDSIGDTWVHLTNAEYSCGRPYHTSYTFPSVESSIVLMPGHSWQGIRTNADGIRLFSHISLHPTEDGEYGQLAITTQCPTQALQSVKPTFHIDTEHVGGYRVTFTLLHDWQRSPTTGKYTYTNPLENVGDSLKFWVGDDCYLDVELTEIEEPDENGWVYRHYQRTLHNVEGKAITLVHSDLDRDGDSTTYEFTLHVQPSFHRPGWFVVKDSDTRSGVATLGAYIPGPLPSEVSCERGDGEPVHLLGLEVVLTTSQDSVICDAVDGNLVTLTLDSSVAVPPPEHVVKLRLEIEGQDDPYNYYQGNTYNAVLANMSTQESGQGILATRSEDTTGNILIESGDLSDGEHVVNLFWEEEALVKVRESVSAVVADDTLTFSGGEGDTLPDLYQTFTGELYYRQNDSIGYARIGTDDGLLATLHPVNLTWTIDDINYERTGCILQSIYGETTGFKKGTGDPLPVIDTIITIHQLYVDVHVCEQATDPEIAWGGTYQFDLGTEPTQPISRAALAYNEDALSTTYHCRYCRSPRTQDFTSPWGYRVTINGYPNDDVNGEYILAQHSGHDDDVEPTSLYGGYYKITEAPDEVLSSAITYRWGDDSMRVEVGTDDGFTSWKHYGNVSVTWIGGERTGCYFSSLNATSTLVAGGDGDAFPAVGTMVTIRKPARYQEYLYLETDWFLLVNLNVTHDRLVDAGSAIQMMFSGDSRPFLYDYVTYGDYTRNYINTGVDAILYDCPQFCLTSENPIHEHVYHFDTDRTNLSYAFGNPPIEVDYCGILSFYHAKIDDTHGVLRAPDDDRLMPPVGWTGNLNFQARHGGPYNVYATIEITGRSGGDAEFVVTHFTTGPPNYGRSYLPPVEEVESLGFVETIGTLSEIAPDLTITIECIDHEP